MPLELWERLPLLFHTPLPLFGVRSLKKYIHDSE